MVSILKCAHEQLSDNRYAQSLQCVKIIRTDHDHLVVSKLYQFARANSSEFI